MIAFVRGKDEQPMLGAHHYFWHSFYFPMHILSIKIGCILGTAMHVQIKFSGFGPRSLLNPTNLTCEVKISQALQGLHQAYIQLTKELNINCTALLMALLAVAIVSLGLHLIPGLIPRRVLNCQNTCSYSILFLSPSLIEFLKIFFVGGMV